MTTDDDNQSAEPDPWAGLDIGNGDAGEEAGAFDFASLDETPPTAFTPVDEPPQAEREAFSFETNDQPDGDPSPPALRDEQHAQANEIPLALFPPPEVDSDGSDILIGTGRSGIIPMAEAADEPGSHDFASADLSPDDFDDNDIAHELGLADIEAEEIAAEAADSGGGPGPAADFGEPVGGLPAEDVSFDAGAGGADFPFADVDHMPVDERLGAVADESQSGHDVAAIAFSSAAAAAGAAAVVATPAAKRAGRKAKGGGLGQMVGVVMGGLLALPVTYAILIWGLHKDPFKLAKKAPAQLAFLLPEKLQSGTTTPNKKPEKADTKAGPKAGPSLDDIPTGDDVAVVVDEPSTEAADGEPTMPPEPTDVADSKDDAEAAPGEIAAGEMKPEGGSGEKPADAEPAPEPVKPAAPGRDVAADLAIVAPPMAADPDLDALDSVPGLDGLASAGDAVPAAAVPAAPPPLDMTRVETAVERASEAFDALGAISDPADPARDRLAVSWYKRLAQLGEELVRLETAAADSGRPLEEAPAAAAALLDRICDSDAARQDLEKLGPMWLTRQRQRANGVTLLATLDSARQVGPYWSTKAVVARGHVDDADRIVAVISRVVPPVEAGERIVISGVLFDGDTVWAADFRPVDRPVQEDFGREQE